MPINNTSRTAGPYLGNGVNKSFPFAYKVFTRQDVLVALTDAAGKESLLILDADYTVTLNADQDSNPGGIITTAAAPAIGASLAATSNIDLTQPLDITNGGGFYPKVISQALDRIVIQIQQLSARVGLGQNVGASAILANVLSFIDRLASSVGGTLVGFLQGGTGASVRTAQSKMRETLSPADFGAILDGTANDYQAMQNAVLYCAKNGGGTVRLPDGGSHKMKLNQSVIVPGYVTIDLNGYVVSGFATGVNYVFESGYLSPDGTTLLSNVGTAARSHSVLNMRIINGLIINAKGIRLQDCLDSCDFNTLGFTNCTENINQTACFYSSYRAIMSRGSAGLSELPGFKFNNNVNAQIFDSISVVDRNIGMEFSGGVNGASLRATNAEGGRTGLTFKDQISAMSIDSAYIEAQTTVGMDFTEPTGKECVTVNNSYFNNVPVGIWGAQMRSGVTIARGNYFVNTPVWVRITDNLSAATVELQDTVDADNGLPRIRPEYQLGPRINIIGRNLIYDSGSGLPIGCNIVTGGIVPLYYGGNCGYAVNNIMFTTVTSQATTGTKFNVLIDTKIVFDKFVFWMFCFTIQDNDGVVTYYGIGSGSRLITSTIPAGKTLTAFSAAGYLRIVVGEHNHPAGTYIAEGIVRIP